MGFEEPSFEKTPPDEEKKLNQNAKDGWIFENGIWRKPAREESIESTKEGKKEESEKNTKENEKRRKELDQNYEELEKKEYKRPEDLEEIKKIEKEHQKLSDQIKELEESKKTEEKQKESAEGESKEESKKDKKENKKEELKDKIKSEKEKEALKVEQEIIKNYYEELEKIKAIPENTDREKKQKVEKYFELIDEWKDQGHKDNYKGIQKIISEIDKLEPKAWFLNLAKNQTINKVALTMASNYKEWDLENKEKTKIIKNLINKQKESFWENKDQALKKVAELLASQEVPYKGNIDFIIRDIKNPDIKTETLTKILDIEKDSIEQKKQLFKNIKEEIAEEGKIDAEKLEDTALSLGFDELFKNPEALSKMFAESSELMKNPEIQKKWKELNKTIERVAGRKDNAPSSPDSVKKAKESIKKPGSKLDTIFGTAGWIILLFLALFMLAELKGVDYLVGQSSGGKKK